MRRFLYKLTPRRDADYGETEVVIVRARSSAKARKIAGEALPQRAIDSPVDWTDPNDVHLVKIGEATPGTRQTEEVVLESNRGA